ncbi:MAG: hypothetical protein LBJ21_08640 [Acidobacteriota bacterium]|jgi:hypothetical protein|nr:hypothetical protein [Acidobacteriota bacterium]
MTIKKRALILSALLAFALFLYGAVGYYSHDLIYHVVEQSLIQKAPAGVDSQEARLRLEALVGAEPDKKARVQRLLKISEYLEKIQRLTPEEWDGL